MAVIQRPVKTYGTRSYVGEVAAAPSNEDPILASEVDGDLDTMYGAWNAGADTVNIKDGAVTRAKLAADANLWGDTGTALTPTTAGRSVTVPGSSTNPNPFLFGSRTIRGRLVANGASDAVHLSINRGLVSGDGSWTQDDPARPSWNLILDSVGDSVRVGRQAASGGGAATLLTLDNAGNLTYPQRTVNRSYTGGIYGTTQTVANGATQEIVLANQWWVSNLNNTGVNRLIADRAGPVLLWGNINLSVAATGIGVGLEIQQWQSTTWQRVGYVDSRTATSLVTSAAAMMYDSNYTQFRLVCTNATGATVTVANAFFVMFYFGAG